MKLSRLVTFSHGSQHNGARWQRCIAGVGAYSLLAATIAVGYAQSSVPDAPAPVPEAPSPQSSGNSSTTFSDLKNQIAPGKGTPGPATDEPASPNAPAAPATTPVENTVQGPPPDTPEAGKSSDYVFRQTVNFVEVPVTVKDQKGQLVAGLTFRDFRVYENGSPQRLQLFTVDPFPLSVAYVIDQSVTMDVMERVNNSLRAIQGALTPYDEVAIFTYNNGTQERTGFTGAQSARLPAVLETSKARGSDMGVPVNSGPLSAGPMINGHSVDPNVQPGRSAGGSAGWINVTKEIHTLNDAVLAAGKELSSRPKGRRRLIYVISDGKENGSRSSYKDVVRYLQTNKIAVYGTLVGDSARWGQGYLNRYKIPLIGPENNILPRYTVATGGTLDAENSVNGIERSYARIAEEARTQYTLGYISHQPVIDGKFRTIDVRVLRPNLEVIAKTGYYPSSADLR